MSGEALDPGGLGLLRRAHSHERCILSVLRIHGFMLQASFNTVRISSEGVQAENGKHHC